jgi:hypothetical protein
MSLSPQQMRSIYENTHIVRRPTYGIISGYHELPYICIGQDHDEGRGCVRVKGRIHVSPRLVLTPEHFGPRYEEIFGSENTDIEIAGRMFGFLGFRGKPVDCKSEYLEVSRQPEDLETAVNNVLDHLHRHEDITTGLIVTPDSRYFPVSIERFIASILDDEFRVV